jgi:hypothetical protein
LFEATSSRFAEICAAFFWRTKVKKTFLSAAAILAFTAPGQADELSDIQTQSEQLREQNQALTKRLADLEKRQQKLEKPLLRKPNPPQCEAISAMRWPPICPTRPLSRLPRR